MTVTLAEAQAEAHASTSPHSLNKVIDSYKPYPDGRRIHVRWATNLGEGDVVCDACGKMAKRESPDIIEVHTPSGHILHYHIDCLKRRKLALRVIRMAAKMLEEGAIP